MSFSDKCCATFITYNPDSNLIANISSISGQVSEIVIVDNASNIDSQAILREISNDKKVTIIFNDSNNGIACALNQAVKYAITHSYRWLLTFDQDSLAPPDYLDNLLLTYHSAENKNSIAIVAPTYTTSFGTVSFSNQRSRDTNHEIYSEIKTTMTSGNLIDTRIFSKVGLFNEEFFIDFVDHEYCLRLAKSGLRIIESHKAVLSHTLGTCISNNILGLEIATTNHSPIRRYYKYRNMITIIKIYLFDSGPIFFQILRVFLSEPFKILMFERDKYCKIKSILRGIYHGLKGI